MLPDRHSFFQDTVFLWGVLVGAGDSSAATLSSRSVLRMSATALWVGLPQASVLLSTLPLPQTPNAPAASVTNPSGYLPLLLHAAGGGSSSNNNIGVYRSYIKPGIYVSSLALTGCSSLLFLQDDQLPPYVFSAWSAYQPGYSATAPNLYEASCSPDIPLPFVINATDLNIGSCSLLSADSQGYLGAPRNSDLWSGGSSGSSGPGGAGGGGSGGGRPVAGRYAGGGPQGADGGWHSGSGGVGWDSVTNNGVFAGSGVSGTNTYTSGDSGSSSSSGSGSAAGQQGGFTPELSLGSAFAPLSAGAGGGASSLSSGGTVVS